MELLSRKPPWTGIVADALNCQKETVKAVIDGGADYLFPVKGNQSTLATGIKDYVEDEELRGNMDKCEKSKKNRARFEKRTAYTTSDIDWLPGRGNWAKITSIGALHTHFETAKETSDEWHYYISSMKLSAEALLSYARKEWSVESMHYLLDMRFGEDFFRAHEQNTQENMNIIRKMVLNLIRAYKNENNDKTAFSGHMLDCLLEPKQILKFLNRN